MSKYIDAEKLKVKIRKLLIPTVQDRNYDEWEYGRNAGFIQVISIVESLQQGQLEPSNNLVDVDAVREDFITEVYRVLDADPTNDRANAIIDAFDSLPPISHEHLEIPYSEEVMIRCNQILIDWVKEGKTPEEREQRDQAHIRFFELYDEYMLDQPEVDLERKLCEYFEGWRINYYSETEELLKSNGCTVDIDDVKEIARHFYELGLNARKEK